MNRNFSAILGQMTIPEIASCSLSASGGLAMTVKNNCGVIARSVGDDAIFSKTHREVPVASGLTCRRGWNNSKDLRCVFGNRRFGYPLRKGGRSLFQTVFVFVAGLGGVFLGMALLYTAIRITAVVVGKWGEDKEKS